MRIWRNGNPYRILGGLSDGIAILENSLEVPQIVKYRVTI